MKKTIIILIQEDNKLTSEVVGDKLTIQMAQALIDKGLEASSANMVVDIRLIK